MFTGIIWSILTVLIWEFYVRKPCGAWLRLDQSRMKEIRKLLRWLKGAGEAKDFRKWRVATEILKIEWNLFLCFPVLIDVYILNKEKYLKTNLNRQNVQILVLKELRVFKKESIRKREVEATNLEAQLTKAMERVLGSPPSADALL